MEKKIKSSMCEKICYGLGGLGANFVWTFMSLYVTMYYTNSVGISAAAAGTMMLVARLLDGVSDVFFAWLMQKVHFKMGKIKPWLLICAPLLSVSLLVSFNVPGSFTDTQKLIYIYVTYTFTAAISYTIFNLAFASTLPLISFDEQDRVNASSVYNFIVMGGIMVMSLLTPVLLAKFGGVAASGSWSKISIIYAIICLIGVTLMGLMIKEKAAPVEVTSEANAAQNGPKMTFRETLKIVLKSKYTWMLLLAFFAFYLYSGASSGLGTYYFMYVLGDVSLSSFGTSSLFTTAAQFISFLIIPFLVAKLGRKKVVSFGIVVLIAASIMRLINPTNLEFCIVIAVVTMFGLTPAMSLIYIYIADITDEIASKYNGFRPAETVSMISSIGTKVGTGIGSALVGWSLASFRFKAEDLVQSAATTNGLIQLMVWLPVITLGIVGIILAMWDIGADAKKKN